MKTAYINVRMMNPRQKAFIVEKGRFTHVGSKRKILDQPINQIIDLKDKTVLPGFNDAHLHVLGLGKTMRMIDVSKQPSIKAMINVLKTSKEEVIIGRGYRETQFEDNKEPSRKDLDMVSTNRPVLLYRFCGHVIIANTKAIEMALEMNGAYPQKREYFDLAKGKFTESTKTFLMCLEKEDKESLKAMILKGQSHLLSHGITSVRSDDFGVVSVNYEAVMNVFKELAFDDALKLRVLEQVNIACESQFEDFLEKGYPHKAFGRFKIGPVKLLTDGSLGARTAALREPYSDKPGESGSMVYDKMFIQKRIEKARHYKMDYAMHAIGDKAIETLIDISETLNNDSYRDAIIHAQLADERLIERMAYMNLGAQVQPAFTATDASIVKARLGNRSDHAYLFNTMIEKNVPVAFSTDAPIESVNPFHTLYAALKRTTVDQALEPYKQSEGITLEKGLEAYTKTGAYFARAEHELGHIKQGELADFIVVDDLDLNVSESLKYAQVSETYIEGTRVYKNEGKL